MTNSAWKSGNVRKIGFFAMVWLLWAACPSEVGAITVAIPTNTTITAVVSNEAVGECVYGETVTITAMVTPFALRIAPTGTVQSLLNGVVIGSAPLNISTGSNFAVAQLATKKYPRDDMTRENRDKIERAYLMRVVRNEDGNQLSPIAASD